MSNAKVTVYTDGASRGNPGPAAAAFVIRHDGVPILEYSEAIGKATNNFAEYTAMIRALDCCRRVGISSLELFSDSELMVKQMRGEYKVKHPDILPLFTKARELAGQLNRVLFTYIPRAENSEADRLGNEALDGKPHPLPELGEFRIMDAPSDDEQPNPDAAQIAILQNAYDTWSAGYDNLKPADVWSQLEKSLIERGRLKTDGDAKPVRPRRQRKK